MGKSGGDTPSRIITVAGCKGGVGKSVISCSLALELGRSGKDVILVDADLGGPNIHTYLGIQSPELVMSDFLARRVKTIQDVVLATDFPGVRLVSSAGNVPSQANPKFAQKHKIIKSVRSLRADLIVIDIGAGSSYDVMDFFSMVDDGVLVTVPEPTSIVNSYGFIKNILYRKFTSAFKQYSLVTELLKRGMNPNGEAGISGIHELMDEMSKISPECWLKAKSMLDGFRPNIIVNMAESEEDILLGRKLKAIIAKYLAVDAVFLGHVEEDPIIRTSAKKMIPFTVLAPDCQATASVGGIANALLQSKESPTQPAEPPQPSAHYAQESA